LAFGRFPIPGQLRSFVTRFAQEFPGGQEVWLFGSRADGTASENSDWDLIAFGDDQLTTAAVRSAESLRSETFSLFIGHGDEFERPWPRARDGEIECATFSRWE